MARRLAKKLAMGEVPPSGSAASLDILSPREHEILSFAAAGYLDKQIGAALGLSLNTLRTYWSRIRAKLGAVPRAALVASFTEMSLKTQEPIPATDWDWEMNLREGIYRQRSSSMVGLDQEMPIEAVLATIHPEDQPGVRWLISAAEAGQFTAFHYSARFLTKAGPSTGSALVRVISDEKGAYLLVGQRIPLMDMRANTKTALGYWGYDLKSDRFWVDDACATFIGIDPDAVDLLTEFLQPFDEASRANIRRLIGIRTAADVGQISRLFTFRKADTPTVVCFDPYVEGEEKAERIVVAVSLN